MFEKVRNQKESREIEKNEIEIALAIYRKPRFSKDLEVSRFKFRPIQLSKSYRKVSIAK